MTENICLKRLTTHTENLVQTKEHMFFKSETVSNFNKKMFYNGGSAPVPKKEQLAL